MGSSSSHHKGVQQFLTFVVPAPDGCNLRCPFCIVHHRNEAVGASLGANDFVQFIAEARERTPVHALALQGYEPLLPESMTYTQAILESGANAGIPTTLVTNGVYLERTLDRLIDLKLHSMAVSLDSDRAEIHDRLRGVPGAWLAAVAGLEKAVLARKVRMVVTSVLLTSKVKNLLGMPRFLADMGVKCWMVNPLITIGKNRGVRPLKQDIEILRACRMLQIETERYGIRFVCDDEFGCIDQVRAAEIDPELAEVPVERVPENIELFRLTPSGQCSVDSDILLPVTPDVPKWTPNVIHAADFLASLPRPPRTAHNRHGKIRGAPSAQQNAEITEA